MVFTYGSVRLNPLPSHEGRRYDLIGFKLIICLNPLPSHEGRQKESVPAENLDEFKSTPFSRRETGGCAVWKWAWECLNPLPSHEGRLKYVYGDEVADWFKSTPFSRRETWAITGIYPVCCV